MIFRWRQIVENDWTVRHTKNITTRANTVVRIPVLIVYRINRVMRLSVRPHAPELVDLDGMTDEMWMPRFQQDIVTSSWESLVGSFAVSLSMTRR